MSAANDAVAVFKVCNSTPAYTIVYKLISFLKDVCTLLNGSEPAFLDLTDISSIYGIALLESILSETVKYFKEVIRII